MEQRVADLEAYVNNVAPGGDQSPALPSNLTGSGPGHNAWMLTSTALVLMMTLPGLALFYGGWFAARTSSPSAPSALRITGLVTILWWLCGYGLVFGINHGYCDPKTGAAGTSPLGDLQYAFFGDPQINPWNKSYNNDPQPQVVNSSPNGGYGYWMSRTSMRCFQLTFAIITPALIVGGIAERMKFSALVIFIGCWMFIVYFPLAHNVWGVDGCSTVSGMPMRRSKHGLRGRYRGAHVLGLVRLTLALIVGKRMGWGKTHFSPHSTVLTFIGASLLWVGWYGFNAGSACAADVIAANAFTTTTLATATASFVWPTMEYFLKGKATVVGFCSGAVAGLVVITPACGYVTPTGGMIIGVIAGTIPFMTTTYLKPLLGYDDALDVFGVHAVGGMCGALATGFLADRDTSMPNLGPTGAGGQKMADLCDWSKGHLLYIEQLKVIAFTLVLSVSARRSSALR
jgi:Amt family ammonium transporter